MNNMKVKCLTCGIVVEVTGKELEQKAAMFNSYNKGADEYLSLLSLTGGECSVKTEGLGTKHFFELEEGTENEIHNVLTAAGVTQTKIKEDSENVNKLKINIETLTKELKANEARLSEIETVIPVAESELEKQKTKFKEITGIENIEKWK